MNEFLSINEPFLPTEFYLKIEKHLLPQFVNTIQSNLSTECIQNQFQFLKDCTVHQNTWAQL